MCNTEQLECGDGQCVPRSWACDGEADCTDGTDEKDCSAGECKCSIVKYIYTTFIIEIMEQFV